jgi:hypothetical protein
LVYLSSLGYYHIDNNSEGNILDAITHSYLIIRIHI